MNECLSVPQPAAATDDRLATRPAVESSRFGPPDASHAARSVLLVAHDFPPSTSPGTQRVLRFARHLGSHGWRPVVLTACEPDRRQAGSEAAGDRALPVRVHRVRVFRPLRVALRARDRVRAVRRSPPSAPRAERSAAVGAGRASWTNRWIDPWFTTPDEQIGWWPAAVWTGLRIIRAERISVLFTTGPPHSTHLVGAALHAISGRPWVADFRDPWSRRPWLDERDRRGLRHRAQVALEAFVVRRADRVVLNTPAMADEFRAFYGGNRFMSITNGFDAELFPRIEPVAAVPEPRFTMTHAGALYRKRDPRPLLRAIARLRDSGELTAQTFCLRLIGALDPQFDAPALVGSLRLESIVEVRPPVPHAECLRQLAASTALLILQPGTHLQVPSKLFEYLYLRKPVLALASEGATAQMIRDLGMGLVADPGDDLAIEQALRSLLRRRSHRPSADADLARYDGRALTGELARLFDQLVSRP